MDAIKYDFEYLIEKGYKDFFNANGLTLLTPDDYEDGDLPDECILINVTTGAAISDEYKAAGNIYGHYSGSIEIEVRTHRLDSVAPTDARFSTRFNEILSNARKLMEETSASDLSTYWPDGIAPVRVIPSGTERENDESFRMVTLSYGLQFRVA